MKYEKADLSYSMESCVQGKIRLHDNESFAETPWVARSEGADHAILLNHALMFLPYVSWGAVLPTTQISFNPLDILEKGVIQLHPEAWDAYIQNKVIDEQGNYLLPIAAETEE